MEIRCPICQHPLDLGPRVAIADTAATRRTLGKIRCVRCPNCGLVALPVDVEETVTFEPSAGKLEGTRLAHFSLVRRLGQGACGEVWLADDILLERQVALKLPISTRVEAAHLLHEAQTAAHLRHPNIVAVHEVGRESGQLFIASEYIEGITLRDYLSAGTPTIARTVEMLGVVAKALHHAHQQGIVHRDVKPSNIILNAEGQPFVTDFGLAKRGSGHETISSEGRVIGTARYMSPEQASGKASETDHRADIYAVGVILFEMLTGHAPFRGNMRALLHQKVFEDAPSPRTLAPALPKDLETICLKCLEREPGKRYQSANDVAEELERFSAGEPIKARPVSSLERAWRWCRRRPAVAGLLAGLLLSLSAGLVGVTFFYWQAATSAELTRRALYRSQMNLAAEYLRKGDISGVRQTLDRVASDGRLAALRGFEWRYYDALTSSVVQLLNQGDLVSDVAISRDGTICASTGMGKTIRVWDVKTGTLIRSLSLEVGRIRAVAFSPANGHLASGSTDGFVRIWSPLKDDKPIQEMKHGPPVAIVRFSPDGRRLLSVGDTGAVRVWDEAAESLVAEIPAGKTGPEDARFSPDGKSIAVASRDGRIRLWDVDSRTIIGDLTPNPVVQAIAFSDDGQMIATGNLAGSIRIWSVSDATLVDTHETVSGRIGDLEFVKGTPLLAILANDGRLHLYDTAARQEIGKLQTHNLTDGVLARSENGKYLAVGSGDGSIKVLAVGRLVRPDVFWHDGPVRGVGFLPDGRHVVAASGDGAIRIWDVEKGESQPLADAAGQQITAVAVQPHGSLIAVAGTAPQVALWDRESGRAVHEFEFPDGGNAAVAFSSSGREMAVVTRLEGSSVYACGDWTKPRFEIAKREAAAHALAFSPDGRDVVVGYENGDVLFINAMDGTIRDPPTHLPKIPLALAFCESGRLLAIGTDSGEIYLYDVLQRRTRSIIKGHTARINALAALPGGTTLVSGGRDKDLRLWDTASGELLTTLNGHRRQVFSIAVSPDGQTIVSGGLEGDVRIWRTRVAR